jgi:hypothetical protein
VNTLHKGDDDDNNNNQVANILRQEMAIKLRLSEGKSTLFFKY